MREPSSPEITALLLDWSGGDRGALERLTPLVYAELRRRAAGLLRRERAAHTLQPTDLIHEAFLRLVDQRRVQWHNRAQFFAVAAGLMRRILVDHARRRGRAKRGGSAIHVSVDPSAVAAEGASAAGADADVLALDEALTRLAALDERQARMVELRFFGGLSLEETAAALGLSLTTVKDELRVAKAWLRRELGAVRAP
jgi:RNA polymerase sigma factor (TIGR02999 family)